MARLQTLKPKVPTLPSRISTQTTAATRTTGRPLQTRRKRCWLRAEAKCERCGKVVAYPHGFELDHKVPLFQGGADTDANCQVLCNGPQGCHDAKTREDMRQSSRNEGAPRRTSHEPAGTIRGGGGIRSLAPSGPGNRPSSHS